MVNLPSAVEFLVKADREFTKNPHNQDIVALLYLADRHFRKSLQQQDDPEAFLSRLVASELDFLGYLEKSNAITQSLFGMETDYGALRERLERVHNQVEENLPNRYKDAHRHPFQMRTGLAQGVKSTLGGAKQDGIMLFARQRGCL